MTHDKILNLQSVHVISLIYKLTRRSFCFYESVAYEMSGQVSNIGRELRQWAADELQAEFNLRTSFLKQIGWEQRHIDDIRNTSVWADYASIRAVAMALGKDIQVWRIRNQKLVVNIIFWIRWSELLAAVVSICNRQGLRKIEIKKSSTISSTRSVPALLSTPNIREITVTIVVRNKKLHFMWIMRNRNLEP